MTRGLLAVIFFLFAMSAEWFRVCEVWQRPNAMFNWDERWILAAAVVGFSAGGVLLPVAKWHRVWIVATLCGLSFTGIYSAARAPAVEKLMRHREVVSPGRGLLNLDALNSNDAGFLERWYCHVISNFHDQSLDHLLEASRWQVRQAFLMAIITDEKHVSLTTRNWHRLFPAVIGQDVTLSRRHELMRLLDPLARDESAAPTSRDAAVLWMGLIVLTDAKEFVADRTSVRDMMLTSYNPPMSLTGDVWMRVLNSMLAFDEPEKIAALSSRLARDRMLLRRAVREGVRGLDTQANVVIHEIERLDASGERAAAAALWLDLRLLIERADGQSAHSDTRHWLVETLLQWLMENSDSVRKRFAPSQQVDGGHRAVASDFVIEMPEQARAKLAAHAMQALESAPSEPEIGKRTFPEYVSPVEVRHALMIRNFLDAEDRMMVSGKIASIVIHHMNFVKDHSQTIKRHVGVINQMALVLLGIKEDLDVRQHQQLKRIFFEKGSLNDSFRKSHFHGAWYNLLRIINESLPSPWLSDGERLAVLATRGTPIDGVSRHWWGGFRVHDTSAFTPEDVEEFLDAFLNAIASREKSFQVSLRPGGLLFHTESLRKSLRLDNWAAFNDDEVRSRNLIRLALIRLRILGCEHLPSNWPEFFHAENRVHGSHWYFPDESYWAPLIATESDTQSLLDHFDKPNDYILRGFIEYLKGNPPSPKIKAVILRHFESRLSTGERSQRINAHRVLLKLSHWLDSDARVAFRSHLHDFFKKDRPALNEWTHTMMLPIGTQDDYPRQYAITNDQCRSEWIEWKDDELSAQLSWSSQIHHELSMLPHDWRLFPDRGLFMYLNTYLDACDANPWTGLECEPDGLDVALSGRYRRGIQPDVPFEATPWQRARELHLRKSGLNFPDRALFRPDIHQR